jgi:hypothetical protein
MYVTQRSQLQQASLQIKKNHQIPKGQSPQQIHTDKNKSMVLTMRQPFIICNAQPHIYTGVSEVMVKILRMKTTH